MTTLSYLTHPRTGEPVEIYDPVVHADPCWKAVTCGNCQREYVCAPWDDYMTPADHLGWDGDPVCELCLLGIAAARTGQ